MMTRLLPLLGSLVFTAACASGNSPVVDPGELYTEEEKAAMSTEDKVEKYNEQVETKDELICRRTARTGSHMHRTRCRTLAEIKDEQQKAQDALTKAAVTGVSD